MSWKLLRKIAAVLLVVCISTYAIIFWLCLDCKSAPSQPLAAKSANPSTAIFLALPRYIGCHDYDESPLSIFIERTDHMTADACLSECYNRDYSFALLKDSDSCYCSSVGGTGNLLTDTSCDLPCTGNYSQRCGGFTSVSVHALRNRNGVQEWTTWMSMEGSSFYKRYRGCIVDANATCNVEVQTKTIGELEDWEKDLKNHFVGCFTTDSLLSTAVKRITPINDWPSLGRECMTQCWWAHAPFASIVTLGSERECVCTENLANSVPVNTCMDMYGAQVFALITYILPNQLKFSAAPLQRKVLLVGYLQNDLEKVQSIFRDQPAAFYTHDIDLLLRASTAKSTGAGSVVIPEEHVNQAIRTAEAAVPIYEVLHPYYRCELHRLSSMFRFWKSSGANDNAGYGSYISCTRLVDGDIGYVKCLPFLEESCKTSSLLVGTTSALVNLWDLDWLIWHNIDVHVIHIIREPLQIIQSQDVVALLERPDNSTSPTVQKLCANILATNEHFMRQQWTRRLHTIFYEEALLSADKIVAFASRKLVWNFTNPGGAPSGIDDLAQTLVTTSPISGSVNADGLARTLAVQELGRQQCAAFYRTFPRRYQAPNSQTSAARDETVIRIRPTIAAYKPQQQPQLLRRRRSDVRIGKLPKPVSS